MPFQVSSELSRADVQVPARQEKTGTGMYKNYETLPNLLLQQSWSNVLFESLLMLSMNVVKKKLGNWLEASSV